MPVYKLRGIDVDFPYEAYDCQLVYMEKVIQSLQEKCNALLESPTGTGKTLCLLCATLAWRKSLGGFSTGRNEWNDQDTGSQNSDVPLTQSAKTNVPTILYASRTHSQLRQVIQELRRTSYRSGMVMRMCRPKMVVLGSREHLCIHEEVSLLRGKAQTMACRKRTKKRQCQHCSCVSDFMKRNPHLGDEPIDIEDLVNIGRSNGPCPYYVSKELHKVVDILFTPYNYLIDANYRKSLGVTWGNSILIFDEAHNLESICAEAASFDLPSWLLTACISEAKNCIDLSVSRRQMGKADDKSCNPDNFAILRALLLKLEKRIAEVPIDYRELGFTRPGPYIYELLADLNITNETAAMLIDIIEQAALLLEEDAKGVAQKTNNSICRLETMSDILQIIFRDGGTAHGKYYRVHVQEVESETADAFKGKTSRTLSWWCFNPGIAMEKFAALGVHSIILTSGTLSPMESFAQELKLKFPVRLENPHVISSNQIWAGVVPAGPSGCSFNSSFRNRDSLEYKQELGNAIVNFARIVPDGLLVFFPSYYILDQCIGCWKNTGHANSTNSSTIWERICKHKQPVIEPRQSALFASSIEDYLSKLKDTSISGAVFFAVCRGKFSEYMFLVFEGKETYLVSEGLDFADHAGRAVVITGIPFATRTDPKVRLKREYLDEQGCQNEGCKFLTGEDWYTQQALRAVNQAVGRVIRHRHDFGAIIFCDERFAHSNRQSQISLWIQPHIKCHSQFGDVVFTLTRFFRDAVTHVPPLLKSRSEDSGDVNEMKIANPVERYYEEKFLTSLSISMDKDESLKSLSSVLEAKRGSFPSQLGGVPPANRSSLTPYEQNQSLTLCSPSDLFSKKKSLLITGRKVQCSNNEISYSFDSSLLGVKPSKEVLATCAAKKRRIEKLDPDAVQNLEMSYQHPLIVKNAQLADHLANNTVKHNNLRLSDGKNTETQFGSVIQLEDDAPKNDAEFRSQKGKNVQSNPVPCSDKETKGSAFLVQVQEKLSNEEYKEFVGSMMALKSKAKKIGQVLESIARLFSGPERLPLLKRFKDYIPAKYHSLYQQYLKSNGETIDTKEGFSYAISKRNENEETVKMDEEEMSKSHHSHFRVRLSIGRLQGMRPL